MGLSFFAGVPESRGDEHQKLFLTCFPEAEGTSAGTRDHYQWKFRGFKSSPPSYEYCAEFEEEMVGYYAAIPFPYVVDGQDYTAGMVCDVMTSPKMRGKGVFTKLGAYSLEQLEAAGVSFVTGYPVRPEVIPGHLKVGWQIAFELPVYVAPVSLRPFLGKVGLGSLARLTLSKVLDLPFAIYWGVYALLAKSSSDISLSTASVSEFLADDSYEAFFARWSAERKNFLQKSKDFISWRLGAPETSETYRVVLAKRERELLGMAIVRPANLKGVQATAVLDMMSLGNDPAVSAALVTGVRRFAQSTASSLIAIMCSRSTARRLSLSSLGFWKTNQIFKLIIRGLRAKVDSPAFLEENNWDLTWLDCDDL